MNENNKMNSIKIEKVVLSIGGTGENLDKGFKLIERISGRKPIRRTSKKRIPSLGVRPGLEVGCLVTIRGGEAEKILKKMLEAVGNQLRKRQISENSFSFGIKEYIEIPGMEYQRDIGIIGLDVSVTFVRPGKRVVRKKIKTGTLPKRHNIPKSEIIQFMEENYKTKFK